ncbi:MAG: putative capsid protein [Cressdnaviricota sp.]|nr:MAG: putative capsid protein [Cressdnaviricota sp.]
MNVAARLAYVGARGGYKYGRRLYQGYKAAYRSRRSVRLASKAAGIASSASAATSAYKSLKRRTSAPTGTNKRQRTGNTVISSSNPGVTTKTFRKLKYKMPKVMKTMQKVGNTCTYRTNSPFGLVGTNGIQVISGDIGYNFANTSLPTMYSTDAIGELYNKAAIAYQRTVPSSANDAFVTQPYNIQTGTTRKFFLRKGGYHIQVSNQGPATVELDCYWLMNKCTNEAATDPVAVWQKGLTETTHGQNAADAVIRFPGSKPTDSKAFNLAYKVLNKTKVFMVPGADHIFKYEFDINRIMDTAYITQFNRVKGVTLQFMLVAKGSVADSERTKAVGTVTTTDLKIAGVVTEFYQTQLLSYWPKVTWYDNKLSTNPGQLWEIGENGPVDAEDPNNYA